MVSSQFEEDRSTHLGGCAGLPMPWDSSSISVSLLMASNIVQERGEEEASRNTLEEIVEIFQSSFSGF